jgi:hypothetical protein
MTIFPAITRTLETCEARMASGLSAAVDKRSIVRTHWSVDLR